MRTQNERASLRSPARTAAPAVPAACSPASIAVADLLEHRDAGVALVLRRRRRSTAPPARRCGRACPRPPPRTSGRFSRLRQSSSVSFQALSGLSRRRSKRRSCSSDDRCIQNLTSTVPSAASARSKCDDLAVGPLPLGLGWRSPRPARRAPGRTRSGRTRPSRPSRAATARTATGSGAASRRSSGAANWATRTCRGSRWSTSRLIAPPLPLASQPSKTMHRPGPSCGRGPPGSAGIWAPSTSRSCSSRCWAACSCFASSFLDRRRVRSTSSRRGMGSACHRRQTAATTRPWSATV